jgi:hypothetical protein
MCLLDVSNSYILYEYTSHMYVHRLCSRHESTLGWLVCIYCFYAIDFEIKKLLPMPDKILIAAKERIGVKDLGISKMLA